MKKEIVHLDGIAQPPSPFSHVVRVGNFLFLSSQLSADLRVHKILGGDISQQTAQALNNIKTLLELSGATIDDVVKTVVYMKDVKKDFEAMNKVYKTYFISGQEPARVTVQALSPIKGIDIEIEVTAILAE